MVVFQDFLTKWPMVIPVPDQKTKKILKLLTEMIVPFFSSSILLHCKASYYVTI